MTILNRFLISKYLKNFLMLVISLEIFYVGMDFMQTNHKLPDSANLKLLYATYNAVVGLEITLPIAMIFAWILTLISLIKSNELVVIYSLGISQKKLLNPIIKTSMVILGLFILLQATPLAYSGHQQNKILHNEYFVNFKNRLFIKYDNYFIYFDKLYPLQKQAKGVIIYKVIDDDIVQTIKSDVAYYVDDRWHIIDATIIDKPTEINWEKSKLIVRKNVDLKILEGFRPKFLDNVLEQIAEFSITDAISSIILLRSQNVDTYKIRSSLYKKAIVPLLMLPILVLILFYVPISSRFLNMGSFIFKYFIGTLLLWESFMMLFLLSNGGLVVPELAILLPIILFYIFVYFMTKNKLVHD